jgi:hypothetical protein
MEEHGLGVFENRVLRLFRPETGEVTHSWRKLLSEGLCNIYFSPYVIRKFYQEG